MRWKLCAAILVLAIGGCGDDAPPDHGSGAPTGEAGSAPPADGDGKAEARAKAKSKAKPGKSWPRREERLVMVQRALVQWGVKDEAVLEAMRRCPRHHFVPEHLQSRAYDNRPLPIGLDQTISQPTVVGGMTEELKINRSSKVLEIGTGSGYQAAVLAEITPHVFSIEIKRPLANRARRTLGETGYKSVKVRNADGYYGWAEEAPFDAIIVTAAAPHVPPPLVKQLKPGGRLVIPVGPPFARQDLVLVIKGADGKVYTQSLYAVAFVPLTGSLGKNGN